METHTITLPLSVVRKAAEALEKVQWQQDRDCMYEAMQCIGCGCGKEFEGKHEACGLQEALTFLQPFLKPNPPR